MPNEVGPPDPAVDPTNAPHGRLLTIEQAAELLQISRCTMQDLVTTGRVHSLRIGRLRRIPPSAIDAFVDHQLGATDPAA